MHIRSYATLDFGRAWGRVRHWVESSAASIPDRLPFEAVQRVNGDSGPPIRSRHHLSPVTIVMSSKKSGTSRPFVRIDPSDLTLYQALVDVLAPDIEAALPGRDTCFAYRQTIGDEADACFGSPTWIDYEDRIRDLFFEDELAEAFADAFGKPPSRPKKEWRYAVVTDVAGYFLHVRLDELERRLFTVSRQFEAIGDIMELLRTWQLFGVRGLPQGVRPSSALGNLYLLPVDRYLVSQGIAYARYMDDWVIGGKTFHAARRTQDEVERQLYELGLTLASDKTRVLRGPTAVRENQGAHRRLEARKKDVLSNLGDIEAMLQAGLTDYVPEEDEIPDRNDAELAAVVDLYDSYLDRVDERDLPSGFRPVVTAILRDLGNSRFAHRTALLPRVLERAPDLTGVVSQYLYKIRKREPELAVSAFTTIVTDGRFIRDQEKLQLCRGITALKQGTGGALTSTLERWAEEDPHELVRARALLAWGVHSPRGDFGLADRFWAGASPSWRLYPLVAIQSKDAIARNDRLDRWSGEGRFLGQIAESIKTEPLAWRSL
jgi:hypothetical protein